MEATIYYYEVALRLSAIWQKNTYTYCAVDSLSIGQVVVVPFGRKEVIGVIVRTTEKPDFETKSIVSSLPIVLPKTSLAQLKWLDDTYPRTPGQHAQYYLPSFITKLREPVHKEGNAVKPSELPPLTDEQIKALDAIEGSPLSTVLHGITGSGKTRIYIELIKKQLAQGKDALLLYPEISLTSQMNTVLSDAFGKQHVHVYNSAQAMSKQRATWQAAYSSDGANVFIGPRSALFLPFQQLGVVIIDEAHDSSYKQDNGSRYNGLIVAASLARQYGARYIIGSATPPVQETQQILSKGGQLVCMHELAQTEKLHETFAIIDMRDKKNHSSASYLLSKPLLSEIERSLKDGAQTLLFLNRRGTARLIQCDNCGWHSVCPDCEMPLIYHHDTFAMQCSVCGHKESVPLTCPDCSHVLRQKTPGIKSIEQEITKLFPQASIARFDSDNKKSESFSERFSDVHGGNVDIIIGTQLITKGLDLPRLRLVGVLQADSSLYLPDYMSEERSFQQLLQVSGRVGRGHTEASIVIQSYSPDSALLKNIEKRDWHAFNTAELARRLSSNYPPFSYLLKLWTSRKSEKSAQDYMTKLASVIHKGQKVHILGPAPAFYGKVGGLYVWQLIIKSASRKQLISVINELPKDVHHDIDPVSLL